jgi:hypothetical protein
MLIKSRAAADVLQTTLLEPATPLTVLAADNAPWATLASALAS